MKITDLSILCKWETLKNQQVIKYLFAPLYMTWIRDITAQSAARSSWVLKLQPPVLQEYPYSQQHLLNMHIHSLPAGGSVYNLIIQLFHLLWQTKNGQNRSIFLFLGGAFELFPL